MDREIKFQVWDKSNEQMMSVAYINFSSKIVWVFNKEKNESYPLEFKDCIIIQFIGLIDEDDKEIYENYIISLIVDGHVMGFYRETEYIGVVKYDEDECVYYLDLIKEPIEGGETIPDEIDGIPIITESDEETKRFYFSEYIVQEDIKILGNIFENPDLLDGAK